MSVSARLKIWKEVRGMARDPVCGMEVDEQQAAATAEYEGTIYYFCAPGCKKAFEKEPERYVANATQMGGDQGQPYMSHPEFNTGRW
jgi:YHS domain-containing protein